MSSDIEVHADIAEMAKYSEDSTGIIKVTRGFKVCNVTDAVVTDRVVSATDAIQIFTGDNHPNYYLGTTKAVKVVDITTKAIDETSFLITVNYSSPKAGTGSSKVDLGSVVEISGTSIEQETNKAVEVDSMLDATEYDMVLGTIEWWRKDKTYIDNDVVVDIGTDNRPHIYKVRDDESPTKQPSVGRKPKNDLAAWEDTGLEWNSDEKGEQNVIAQKYTPIFKIKCSRIETSNPAQNISGYVGKLNHQETTIGNVIWAEKKLLCESITASTDDEGATYSVTYNFLYKSDGWDFVAIYTDEYGMPAIDWEAMNAAKESAGADNPGKETYQLYEEADYDLLNLDFEDSGSGSGS